jgi:hypothetical protein
LIIRLKVVEKIYLFFQIQFSRPYENLIMYNYAIKLLKQWSISEFYIFELFWDSRLKLKFPQNILKNLSRGPSTLEKNIHFIHDILRTVHVCVYLNWRTGLSAILYQNESDEYLSLFLSVFWGRISYICIKPNLTSNLWSFYLSLPSAGINRHSSPYLTGLF